ncbi:MAG: polysaccharide biosynthesis/export family protein [Alloprevotella sp.]|nr:polysaccharide biosynthesis/export family protein [Alloprevotella sp.]MBR1652041.1 polysaccharide biosynthesis/export family protein [Alloprevotella sp.]
MNKFLPLAVAAMLLLCGCHSAEKVIYFQDIESGEALPTRVIEALKLQNGDKVSILVSSAATPDVAGHYNLVLAQNSVGTASRSSQNYVSVYTIDENGEVDIPSLGRTRIAGLTRSEAAQKVQNIFRNGILNDAVVTVSAYDQFVTVLGEVKNPGRVAITKDNMTLLEAIGAVGDLTIQGRRDRVLVMRQEGNETQSYYVDLRSKDVFNSPVYNLRQNDYIYVEPNNVRISQSTYNENSFRQVSTWVSISSLLISLGILIFK